MMESKLVEGAYPRNRTCLENAKQRHINLGSDANFNSLAAFFTSKPQYFDSIAMSIRINFKQALRVARLQKTLRFFGSGALCERQVSQSWSPSSYCHLHSRSASTASATPYTREKKPRISDNQDPVEQFNAHLETGTLTKTLAHSYLKELSKQDRYDAGLGEATIKWMWNDHDRYEFPRDVALLEQVVRHLVKEGKEELAWSWIEQKSRKTAASGPNARFVWRTDTVRAIVSAKAFASDHDSLDGALEAFFRANSSPYSIPLSPARMTCAQLLMMPKGKTGVDSAEAQAEIETPRWPNTSVELWEKFLKSIDPKQDVSEPFSVQLPLYHPGGPNAFPFLKHCRFLAKKSGSVQSMVKKPSISPWIGRGRHAEAVLRQQGHEKDANWLGEFIRELHVKSAPIRKKEQDRKAAKYQRKNK
jgi:hypothetical protein